MYKKRKWKFTRTELFGFIVGLDRNRPLDQYKRRHKVLLI